MKKQFRLMAIVALLALASVTGVEVAIEPPTGFSKRFAYFSGTTGTSSYKLDWETFYARMDPSGRQQAIQIYLCQMGRQ